MALLTAFVACHVFLRAVGLLVTRPAAASTKRRVNDRVDGRSLGLSSRWMAESVEVNLLQPVGMVGALCPKEVALKELPSTFLVVGTKFGKSVGEVF